MYVISICVTLPQVILINANAAAMSHVLGVLLAVPEKHAVRLITNPVCVISICAKQKRSLVILINVSATTIMRYVLREVRAVMGKHVVNLKTTEMNLVRAVISSVTTKTIRLNVNAATMRHVLRIAMPVTKPEISMGVVYLILRPLPGFLSRNLRSEYLQRRVIRTHLHWLSR